VAGWTNKEVNPPRKADRLREWPICREVSALRKDYAGTGSPRLAGSVFQYDVHMLPRHAWNPRNSSTVAPPSKFAKSAGTGTRVLRNTHAPLSRSTIEQAVQSIIMDSAVLISRRKLNRTA